MSTSHSPNSIKLTKINNNVQNHNYQSTRPIQAYPEYAYKSNTTPNHSISPHKYQTLPHNPVIYQEVKSREISPQPIRIINHSNSPFDNSRNPFTINYQQNLPYYDQNNNNWKPISQRVHNISNVERENRYLRKENSINIDGELQKEKEKNQSLNTKLKLLEEIIGNSGFDLMEKKINNLLKENDRLTNILQDNEYFSERNDKKCERDELLLIENEKLRKVIQSQNIEIKELREKWQQAEENIIKISRNSFDKPQSNEFRNQINLLIEENSKLNELLNKNTKEKFTCNEKLKILLSENEKLNSIINLKQNESESLLKKLKELEKQNISEFTQKIENLLCENQLLIEKNQKLESNLLGLKELEEKIELVVEENEKTSTLLQENQMKTAKFQEMNRELSEKLELLIDENQKLNEKLIGLVGENASFRSLEEKTLVLLTENDKLKLLLQEKSPENETERAEISEIEQKIELLIEENNRINEVLKDKELEISFLKEKCNL